MARHRSFEEKIRIVEYYLENGDMKTTAQLFDVHARTIQEWVMMYRDKGPDSLKVSRQHNTYSTDFKARVVNEYLNTEITQRELARKYNVPSHKTVKKWVLAYTEGKKLKSTFGGTYAMTKSRKTTYEERLEIAQYHETHDVSIRELTELYDISYSQAYQYVKKYKASGPYGLEDCRGRRKSDSELTEMDKMKRKLEIERRKRKKVEVENAFLKKLEELERRRK
ncbi:helix-turn-helix domain-containing protein [Salinicoccus sp. YB14-2]|uniref:helix-turn-helix domain-containing protein n=1 Tax=Salinicoccus sp. YB14-2 TaxID=1572701 RepID=UPI0006912BA7|nr:helix-turn-helix domain-containing protein [Salinicoccus sp. YB14-2]